MTYKGSNFFCLSSTLPCSCPQNPNPLGFFSYFRGIHIAGDISFAAVSLRAFGGHTGPCQGRAGDQKTLTVLLAKGCCGWFACWIALWRNLCNLSWRKGTCLWNTSGNRALTLWTGRGKQPWKKKTDVISAVRIGCLWETYIVFCSGQRISFKQSGAWWESTLKTQYGEAQQIWRWILFNLWHTNRFGQWWFGQEELLRYLQWSTWRLSELWIYLFPGKFVQFRSTFFSKFVSCDQENLFPFFTVCQYQVIFILDIKKARSSGDSNLTWKLFRLEMKSHLQYLKSMDLPQCTW